MKLQENPKKSMMIFLWPFLSIVGKVEWKWEVIKNPVKNATNSDEGFALLVLKTSGMNGVKSMKRKFLQNTETNTVSM